MKRPGLEILSVGQALSRRTGISPGDRVLRINGHLVLDELDFRFFGVGEWLEMEIARPSKAEPFFRRLRREESRDLVFRPMKPRRCRNNCLFCFVDQLPAGLRRSLYVKDEDYRFSFLYGNYVTLASIKDQELERVRRMRLTPLYVSVHATDHQVRNLLLGRKKSRDILETITVLAEAGITLHTQVVLCPGINDGKVLEKTIRDLAGFYPAVASIAVVPVGLTRYRLTGEGSLMRPVNRSNSVKIINKINSLNKEFKDKYDESLVFLADEFYRKSGCSFPPFREYGDFPQWENGVGMIPFFLRQVEARKGKQYVWSFAKELSFTAVTGELAFPYVRPYVDSVRLNLGVDLRLLPVRNLFFGRQVNVTGLLTGRDIIEQARSAVGPGSVLLVPEVVLNQFDRVLLDDTDLEQISQALQVPVQGFVPDPAGFEKVLEKYAKIL